MKRSLLVLFVLLLFTPLLILRLSDKNADAPLPLPERPRTSSVPSPDPAAEAGHPEPAARSPRAPAAPAGQVVDVSTGALAGPAANPLRRYACAAPGQIRADDGQCVAVEAYLGTGSNRVFWVSEAAGNDGNPGTRDKPWKTIGRAAGKGVLRPGDAVIVRAGLYREAVSLQEEGAPGRLITFAAYPGETVVVSGAEVLEGPWTRVDGAGADRGAVWRHPWRVDLKSVPPKGDNDREDSLAWRRELFVDRSLGRDSLLRPVEALARVRPGTFWVQGSTTRPEYVYLRLHSDGNPNGTTVQGAVRNTLFTAGTEQCGQGVQPSLGYLRVMGFVFRHAANRGQVAALCTGSEGSLLEENLVEATNGTGIKALGKNHTLIGNVARYNGDAGIAGSCIDCLVAYNESRANNHKPYQLSTNGGGGKWTKSKGTVIRHHLAVDNLGPGLWLDIDNADNTVEKSLFLRNTSGIAIELRTTRTTVRNNLIYGSRSVTYRTAGSSRENTTGGYGILSHAASHNDYLYNTIAHNDGIGIRIKEEKRGPDGHNRIYNNLLIGNGRNPKPGDPVREIHLEGESRENLLSNKLEGNAYWPHDHAGGDRSTFRAFYPGKSVPTSELADWQAGTGGDLAALVLDPGGLLVDEAFWPVKGSQVIGKAVALPQGLAPIRDDLAGNPRPPAGGEVGALQYVPGRAGSASRTLLR